MSLLAEWLSEAEAAREINKSVRTLRGWRRKKKGPPYAFFGRTVKYRMLALAEYYRASEVHPERGRKPK
jgi:hypothetical protein